MGKSTTGWWYTTNTYPSEKYDFVSWDDDIPKWMESPNPVMFQTTNQTISMAIFQFANC